MSIPLPLFIAVPLLTAFLLPIFGKKAKDFATFLANVVAFALVVMALTTLGQARVYEIGKWSIPLGINLVLDGLSSLLLLAIAVVSASAMLFSVRYMEQYTAKSKFLCLFMLMLAGMNGVALSGDIFNLFVFIEIASLASYALVAFGCGSEELEASFKYMVLGEIASLFILFAVALTYAHTGFLNMAYISQSVVESGMSKGLCFALGLFIVGFGLKAALVPFHAWLPDAHPSAPAPISAMLSGVLIKTLGVYALARILFNVFGVFNVSDLNIQISWVIITLAILSMLVGAFLAFGQTDIKRLMAYSSISQVGYIVLGLGLGGLIIAKGQNLAWASLAIMGGLFHLLNHSVYKSLLFLSTGSIQMSTGTRDMTKMGGLAQKLPVTRTTATIASAAIAGIPPFSGFWSKLVIVIAAVQANFYWIGALIVFVSLCTLIMYLKLQRFVFLGELPENLKNVKEQKGTMQFALILLALLSVFMGLILLVPSLKANILEPAAQALNRGAEYAQNVIQMTN
jgi:multicomponent Na+:H+ antiporter subunit D